MGSRLLRISLERGHHRGAAHPGSLDSLPLEQSTYPATMTYYFDCGAWAADAVAEAVRQAVLLAEGAGGIPAVQELRGS
jgi:hypothetical protein